MSLITRADGSKVLTVSKNNQDIQEIPINNNVDFATVEVESFSARVRFSSKRSDFEIVSELNSGGENYDVKVKLYQC